FLSNPEYDKKINFSEVFKTTEIPIYNNMKKAQQTKPLIEEKPKQIKETKCTCQACGKVWFYGKEEVYENRGKKLENFSNYMSNAGKDMMCCIGCFYAFFVMIRLLIFSKDLY